MSNEQSAFAGWSNEQLTHRYAKSDIPEKREEILSELLTRWHEANALATAADEREKALRALIFNAVWPEPKKGRNLARLPHGMALVGTYRMNYRIDRGGMDAAREFIPLELFQQVVQFSPRISESAFLELEPEQSRLFDDFVTMTPGSPALEIKPANKIRWPR